MGWIFCAFCCAKQRYDSSPLFNLPPGIHATKPFEVEGHNPVKQKIREITGKFPFWGEQILFPKVIDNMIEGEFHLKAAIHIESDKSRSQKMVTTKISMRTTGVNTSDSIWLFNTIGEYCLCRKTEKILGYDSEKWNLAIQNTEMTLD